MWQELNCELLTACLRELTSKGGRRIMMLDVSCGRKEDQRFQEENKTGQRYNINILFSADRTIKNRTKVII